MSSDAVCCAVTLRTYPGLNRLPSTQPFWVRLNNDLNVLNSELDK